MQRARRKKGKGKKVKKVKKKCLNERETLSYEQEILENNRQLARLRSRNEALEEEAEVAKEKLRQLEEDRSDVIAHLKRNLEEKIQESKELNERLTALEELRKDELAAYKKREDAMELEYRTMENNLSAEVKLAAGKLNALEDWRLARLDLMQRYEKQEMEMAEQEKRHKEAIYEAEKSVVIGKASMQKEMNERLQVLSEELRKSTTLRMAEIMHRAIRENVALNRELDNMLKINKELESVSTECKKTEETLRLKSQLFEDESRITLKKVLKQRDVIHKLANDFQDLLIRYAKAEKYNTRFSNLQKILDDVVEQTNKKDKQIQALKKDISIARNDKQQLSSEIQEKEKQLEGLKRILNRVKSLLDEVSQVTEDAINKQQCIDCMGQVLLHSLDEILQTENLTTIIEYTPSEIEGIDCHYTTGCLGLVEPLEPCKCSIKEEKEESVQDSGEEILSENLEQRVPSCISSVISSSISSPKEE